MGCLDEFLMLKSFNASLAMLLVQSLKLIHSELFDCWFDGCHNIFVHLELWLMRRETDHLQCR